jgi:hypothetical protein
MRYSRISSVLGRELPRLSVAGAAALLIACGGPTGPGTTGGGGSSSGERGVDAGALPGASSSSSAGSPSSGPLDSGARCSVVARDLAVGEGKAKSPAIAWGGGHFGVAWTSLQKDEGDIVFALLDSKGHKVIETPVDNGPGPSSNACVVPIPSGYLVLWQVPSANGSSIRARRLRADGTPAGDAFAVAETQSKEARPVGAPHKGEGDAVVAWADTPGSFVGLLRGDTLSDKRPIDPASKPSLSASGSALGVVWLAGPQIGVSRLSVPLGSLTPVLFRQAAGKANMPRIAAHEDGSFDVAWEDDRDGSGEENVYVTRVGADGKVAGEIAVPAAPGSANFPDVAWTGARTAVVYYQFRDGPPAIYLSWITADLTRSEDDLQVSGKRPARWPRLAFTGDTLGITYADKDGPVRLSLVACR